MPTRPVTWELDTPPGQPPAGADKTPRPAREIPSIGDLRGSLLGGRFELFKIGAFATFLFTFVALAVHGSHLTSADNQFAADTSAAIGGLAGAISHQSGALAASVHQKTSALASSAMQSATMAAGHVSVALKTIGNPSPADVAEAPVPIPQRLARNHHHSNRIATTANVATARANRVMESEHIENVAFVVPRAHHHHRASRVKFAVAETPTPEIAPEIRWSGNVLDLPDFITAEASKAAAGIVALMENAVELVGFRSLRNRGEVVMTSLGNKFDVTNPDAFSMNSPSSLFSSLFNTETAAAACAGLLIYMILVVVLVQVKGSLRAVCGHTA